MPSLKAQRRAVDLAIEINGVVNGIAKGYLVRSYSKGVFLVTEDDILTLVTPGLPA